MLLLGVTPQGSISPLLSQSCSLGVSVGSASLVQTSCEVKTFRLAGSRTSPSMAETKFE